MIYVCHSQDSKTATNHKLSQIWSPVFKGNNIVAHCAQLE